MGYTGGQDTSPSYNSVCSGRTGHTEAVQVQLASAESYDMTVCFVDDCRPGLCVLIWYLLCGGYMHAILRKCLQVTLLRVIDHAVFL